MSDPVERIRGYLRSHNCDLALLTDQAGIRWATGFSGSNGLALVSEDSVTLLTDSRYTVQAGQECPNSKIEIVAGNLPGRAARMITPDLRVVLDPEKLTAAAFSSLQHDAPSVEYVLAPGWLNVHRGAKSDAEIERIAAAQAVTDAVFNEILAFIRPGVTEYAIAAEIVYAHRKRGASAMSFEPIVASGPNGALPHARPGTRALEPGDPIVIDMGCYLDGYASDMTRTVVLGAATEEFREAYAVVHEAKETAIRHARASMSARDLDESARAVIRDAQLGNYFVHSLGHGVGLEVHEWPRLAATSDDALCANAVVTIEPGVYIPGKWGIRIEDIIVLTADGCRNLTSATDALIELPV